WQVRGRVEAAVSAEDPPARVFHAAEHHRLAHEGDSGQPATAITRRLADQQGSRADGLVVLEVPPEIAPPDGVPRHVARNPRVLIAGAVGNFRPRKSIEKAIETGSHPRRG